MLPTKITSETYRKHWDAKRARLAQLRDNGIVLIEFIPTNRSGRIHVTCRASKEFSAGAKELGGKWRHRSLVWTFPAPCKRLLVKLCTKVYGEAAVRLKGFGKVEG